MSMISYLLKGSQKKRGRKRKADASPGQELMLADYFKITVSCVVMVLKFLVVACNITERVDSRDAGISC